MKRRNAFFLALVTALAGGHAARAECPYIGMALKSKMAEYKEYRQRNELTLQNLLETKKGCETRGTALSTKIATMSAALSCQAQTDVSAMDQELHELGGKCETTFQKIHSLQAEMHAQFDLTQNDLEQGFAFMKKTEILQKFCQKEIQATKKSVDAFLELETTIVQVDHQSLDGQTSYGKFKEMAQQLHETTAARGRDCGKMDASLTNAVAGTRGQGAEEKSVPAGESPRSPSDITGTSQAKLESVAGTRKAPRPEMKEAAPPLESANPVAVALFAATASAATTPAPAGSSATRSPASVESVPQSHELRVPPKNGGSVGAVLWAENLTGDIVGLEMTISGPAADVAAAKNAEEELPSAAGAGAGAGAGGENTQATNASRDNAENPHSLFQRVSRAYHRTAMFREAAGMVAAAQPGP